MTTATIEKILRAYKGAKGSSASLQARIVTLQRQADSLRAKAMSEEALKAQKVDAMPHGTGTGDPTAQLVLRFMSGYIPEDVQGMEEKLAEAKFQKWRHDQIIAYAEAWLEGLKEKERWIIERQTVDGAFWREVQGEFKRRYGIDYTREGLKYIKSRALENIAEIVGDDDASEWLFSKTTRKLPGNYPDST